jgi:hypothetical protein
VTSCELRVASCELRITSTRPKPRVCLSIQGAKVKVIAVPKECEGVETKDEKVRTRSERVGKSSACTTLACFFSLMNFDDPPESPHSYSFHWTVTQSPIVLRVMVSPLDVDRAATPSPRSTPLTTSLPSHPFLPLPHPPSSSFQHFAPPSHSSPHVSSPS